MTQSPTALRAESPHDAAIIRLWAARTLDTRDLASRFGVSEAHVYNLIAHGEHVIPDRAKIAYAGRP